MTAQQGVRPAAWFKLHRHDDPTNDPASGSEDEQAEQLLAAAVSAAEDAKPTDDVPPEVKKALQRANKEAESLRLKLKAYEDEKKTEAEKLAERADAAEKRELAATARAVKAEVKALADGFADREDAVLNLGDLGKYVKDGDVDTDAISDALSKVLERKPHLAAKAATPRNPLPDPSQGRGGDNQPTDYRTADKATFEAELAKLGLRPRS